MPVSTLLQHAYHGTDSAALLPGRMRNRLWCAFSALGWTESRFGIDFLVVFFSIVIVSVIIVSLSMRRHLSCRATTSSSLLPVATAILSCGDGDLIVNSHTLPGSKRSRCKLPGRTSQETTPG